MIPFALTACIVHFHDASMLETSLDTLSALGFTFRLPVQRYSNQHPVAFTVHFYQRNSVDKCILLPGTFTLTVQEQDADSVLYRVETDSDEWKHAATAMMHRYSDYTRMKLEEAPAVLSQNLLGYPAEQESCFMPGFLQQRSELLKSLRPDRHWGDAAAQIPSIAISLNRHEFWLRYLSLPWADFQASYWAEHGLNGHPIAKRQVDCLYIGNAYCPFLFPDAKTLSQLLNKATVDHLHPVLVLSTVSENQMEPLIRLLLDHTDPGQQIVVNDLGMALALQPLKHFRLTLGTLMNKRRKDPRLKWLPNDAQQRKSPLNARFYLDELSRTFGITRLSVQACGYSFDPPAGSSSLHIPFYVMNTSNCALRSILEEGERGLQRPSESCMQYCSSAALLYPAFLNVFGRFNALFGTDRRSMEDSEYLLALMGAGTNRLVVDLL